MIKVIFKAALVMTLLFFSTPRLPSSAPAFSREINNEQTKAAQASPLWVAGRTQCCPGRKGTIAPVPLHPVVEVLVAAGDRVKKDKVLVKLDDDEPQADVRNRKAVADSAKIALEEAERYLKKAEQMFADGVYPEARYFAARTAALKASQDERAAIAAWEGSKAELEHYEVTAQIDGVICWLDVYPGMVSRPGTTVWGEIMDLSEIDVRCDVSLEQADRIKVGQEALIRQTRKTGVQVTGKIVLVGITVDAATGLVSVVARLPNAEGILRCGEAVQISFAEGEKGK
jgi:membrane fusion protein, multidrug efflux system